MRGMTHHGPEIEVEPSAGVGFEARKFYENAGFGAVARGHEPFWNLEHIKYEWSGTDRGA